MPPAPMTAIRMSALRPFVADWIAAVPADRRRAHRVEDAHAGRGRLGHPHHCAGMTFVQEIEPRADAAHLDPVAHRLLDVADDDPDLAHRPEQSTHRLSSLLSEPGL